MSDADWLWATEEGDRLRVEWDNRRSARGYLRPGSSAALMLVCIPVVLILACVAAGAVGPEPWYWRALAALGAGFLLLLTLAAGYDLLARWWTEWLEVSSASVTHGYRGRLAGRPATYRLRPGAVWSFGRHGDESQDTVRLTWESSLLTTNQVEFAKWLAAPARERVFLAVARFVEDHQLPLAVRRYDR